jgi:hypothetical protein
MMKVPHDEGGADYIGPESCGGCGKTAAEALTGESAGVKNGDRQKNNKQNLISNFTKSLEFTLTSFFFKYFLTFFPDLLTANLMPIGLTIFK